MIVAKNNPRFHFRVVSMGLTVDWVLTEIVEC